MNLLPKLQRTLADALAGLVPDPSPYAAQVKATQDPRHGDYQANCAMALAKVLGKPPREVAQQIISRLDLGDWLRPPEVAGPGFINLRLRDDWMAAQLRQMALSPTLGVEPPAKSRTYVIDYGSPNVAKPMHVGHLRSTIIGDALARLLRFLGHKVIADNHIGDWGNQFGMLLYGYKHFLDAAAYKADPVQELGRLYKHVRSLIKKVKNDKGEEEEDPNDPIMIQCREETTKLQAGDEENNRLWKEFMPACYAELDHMYARLDIHYDETLGESFYQPMLAGVERDLLARGIAEHSRGAVVIFFGDPEKTPPAFVRYSHGAFGYMTTDLATVKYRVEHWHPDAILYVVGAPQSAHFKQLFDAARRWGYDKVELEHVSFGSVLGPDRKMFKTREGKSTALEDLLDEGVAAAEKAYRTLRQEALDRGEEVPDLSDAEVRQIAEVVGTGAIKYADLSQNRTSDYVFSWDKMLAMNGNTGTYMQYAYVRNRGIFRKESVDPTPFRTDPPTPILGTPEERALALQLLRFPDALLAAVEDYRPSQITGYLWDLAKTYSRFFDACPVLKAETPELRRSRLLLCDLTARVIQRGLDLLGIRTVERM
jgi:arginyl-tRNA synthetase